MLKTKHCWLPMLVALGTALPVPSATASELVKLGKLIVTGKRAPDPRPTPPSARDGAPAERVSGIRSEPSPERVGAGNPGRMPGDAALLETSSPAAEPALGERASEPTSRQGPAAEPARGER